MASHSLRKRKNLPGWSNGAVRSSRPLLVIGDSRTRCQFVELRFVVDSRRNPVDVNGQERARLELLRATPRRRPAEALVFNSTETPRSCATTRSGLPSPLKSPTETESGDTTP